MSHIRIHTPAGLKVELQDDGHAIDIAIHPPAQVSASDLQNALDERQRVVDAVAAIRGVHIETVKRHTLEAIPKALTLRDRTKNALVLTTEDARELNEISLGLIRHLQTIAEASGALPAAKPSERGEDS